MSLPNIHSRQSGRSTLKVVGLLLVVLILLAGVAGFFALSNLDSLIAYYKPTLESTASAAIGAPVKLGEVETKLLPSIEARMNAVDIGEGNAISVNSVDLKVKLLPLLSKRLEVEALEVVKPVLTIEKTARGISVHGLPDRTERPAPAERKASGSLQSPKNRSQPPLAIAVESLAVRDGHLTLKGFSPGATQEVDDLEFSSQLAVSGETTTLTEVKLAASVKSVGPLALTAGHIGIDASGNHLVIKDALLELLSSAVRVGADFFLREKKGSWTIQSKGFQLASLTQLRPLLPSIPSVAISGTASADLAGEIGNGNVEARGSAGLANVSLQQGAFKIAGLSAPCTVQIVKSSGTVQCEEFELVLNDNPVRGKLSTSVLADLMKLNQLEVNAFEGVLTSNGTYQPSSKDVRSGGRIGAMQLAPLLAVFAPSMRSKIEGRLESVTWDISFNAAGDIPRSLNGKVTGEVTSARILGFNLLASVVNSLRQLPFLDKSLSEALPDQVNQALKSPDTRISRARLNASLRAGTVESRDVLVESDLFILSGAFTLSPRQELAATMDFAISEHVAPAIVGKVKELAALQNAKGQLVIPLRIEGTLPSLQVIPRTEEVTKLVMTHLAREKGGKLLDKALGKGAGEQLKQLFKF